MTEEEHRMKQRARMALISDAREWKREMLGPIYEWEDRARESEAGMIVGGQEIDAIVNVIWGLG